MRLNIPRDNFGMFNAIINEYIVIWLKRKE